MAGHEYDLRYDANGVGTDLVVETWISHSPRARDAAFDPQVDNWLLAGDDEEPPVRARVVRRDGNCVWVQLDLNNHLAGSSPSMHEVLERIVARDGGTVGCGEAVADLDADRATH